jgi:uncharacterized protein YbaA (DUF1428 family)
MAGYVDLYLLPVPKKHMKTYRKMASVFGKVIKDQGALEYREFVASGAKPMHGIPGVDKLLKPKKGEVLVFSVAGFRNKKHRDKANAAMMNDPRMAKMMKKMEKMGPVFDMKRMHLSEFETLIGFTHR